MTIFTSECIQQAGLDFAAIRESSNGIMNKFYSGNDFPFLYNQKLVNPPRTGESNSIRGYNSTE